MSNPDFSNVLSGSSSTAKSENSTGSESSTGSGRTYVVSPGDSLSKIAKRLYGKMDDWRKIYDANRDIITNPDLIYPGQTLRLP